MVDDGGGAYPALALDGSRRRADAVASNMGHLPGTGIVDGSEIACIAARLSAPDMASGWGLRTLSATSPRFNPLSYHGGSVWPHDTVIAAANLALAGHGAAAMRLLGGLVEAASAFRGRLPELFGGERRVDGLPPLSYPGACRPQAWSAASSVLLRCLLGLDSHAPRGTLRLRPVWPPPFAELEVHGLRVGGCDLSVAINAEGVCIDATPPSLHIEVVRASRLATPPGPASSDTTHVGAHVRSDADGHVPGRARRSTEGPGDRGETLGRWTLFSPGGAGQLGGGTRPARAEPDPPGLMPGEAGRAAVAGTRPR